SSISEINTPSLHDALPIFTGNLDLAKKIGLQASRRFEFFSGKLDCRLLQYELYEGSKERPGTVATSQEIRERTPEIYPERRADRSEEHTSELQSRENLVCR